MADEPKAPRDYSALLRPAAVTVLGASVFVLAVIGKVPVSDYMTYVVVPGLALFGITHVAKNLN